MREREVVRYTDLHENGGEEEAVPPEEGGEGEKTIFRKRAVVSCTDPHEEEGRRKSYLK